MKKQCGLSVFIWLRGRLRYIQKVSQFTVHTTILVSLYLIAYIKLTFNVEKYVSFHANVYLLPFSNVGQIISHRIQNSLLCNENKVMKVEYLFLFATVGKITRGRYCGFLTVKNRGEGHEKLLLLVCSITSLELLRLKAIRAITISFSEMVLVMVVIYFRPI